jgi:hypothetical protein
MHKLSPTKLRWISYSIVFFMTLYIVALLVTLDDDATLENIKEIPFVLYLIATRLEIKDDIEKANRIKQYNLNIYDTYAYGNSRGNKELADV